MKNSVSVGENKYIQKFLINLLCQGIVIVFMFAFIYGKFFTGRIDTIKFIISILSIEVLGLLIYYILRVINKRKYIFCDKYIKKVNHKDLMFCINIIDIVEIYYIRIWWIFFMQFGSGSLIIRYKEGGEYKNINISMSLNDVNRIYLIINKEILIK